MSGPESCDTVMLELFRAEMDTHLPALSQGLLLLEKGQAGQKDFEAMMRAAHSIKGAARIVGIDAAVRVAHVMEDCFSAAQTGRLALSSECVDVLLQGVDTLQRTCAATDAPVTQETIESLVEHLAAIREGKPPQRSSAPGPAASSGAMIFSTPPAQPAERFVKFPALFDDQAAELLRQQLAEVLDARFSRLHLDFSPVEHVTAKGLALLASLARELEHRPPAPAIDAEGMSMPMTMLLRTTGLDRVFRPLE
jgi:two-component system sensor histidine kinase and response regulator WspE